MFDKCISLPMLVFPCLVYGLLVLCCCCCLSRRYCKRKSRSGEAAASEDMDPGTQHAGVGEEIGRDVGPNAIEMTAPGVANDSAPPANGSSVCREAAAYGSRSAREGKQPQSVTESTTAKGKGVPAKSLAGGKQDAPPQRALPKPPQLPPKPAHLFRSTLDTDSHVAHTESGPAAASKAAVAVKDGNREAAGVAAAAGESMVKPAKATRPPLPQSQPLQTPWQEVTDAASGSIYYWNTATNATSWQLPSDWSCAVHPVGADAATAKTTAAAADGGEGFSTKTAAIPLAFPSTVFSSTPFDDDAWDPFGVAAGVRNVRDGGGDGMTHSATPAVNVFDPGTDGVVQGHVFRSLMADSLPAATAVSSPPQAMEVDNVTFSVSGLGEVVDRGRQVGQNPPPS